MKIRSITYFCNPKYPLDEKVLQKAGVFLTEARSAYEAAGYEVQTMRLATIPFPKLLSVTTSVVQRRLTPRGAAQSRHYE